MNNLVLTYMHHLLVFGIAALLAAEFALLRDRLDATAIRRLFRIDMSYGVCAGLILLVGFGRVYDGLAGPEFYLPNPVFWTKLSLFLIVGLLSIPLTVRLAAADSP